MTTPDERTRSLLLAEEFLLVCAFEDITEADRRDYARRILRHYPGAFHIGTLCDHEKAFPEHLQILREIPELDDRELLEKGTLVRIRERTRPAICGTDSRSVGEGPETRVSEGSEGVEAFKGAED